MLSYCKEPIYNKYLSFDFSAGTGTPIILQDVKDYLRVTFADDDASITTLIAQCIQSIERYCCISIYTRTITMVADVYFEFELPYGPAISVTGVTVAGTASTGYTYADGRYTPQSPTGRTKIVYTAGNYLPDSLKLAVYNEIAFRYENKGDDVSRYAQQNVGISEGAQALAADYRRFAWL